jgi:hypothetical protein
MFGHGTKSKRFNFSCSERPKHGLLSASRCQSKRILLIHSAKHARRLGEGSNCAGPFLRQH